METYERQTDCDECGEGCREVVHAVNVSDQRGPDGYGHPGEYQHVAEYDLVDETSWSGEQCGSCGNSGYSIIKTPTGWAARCDGQYLLSGDDDEWQDGCGAVYPIVKVQSHYVVF